MTGPLLFNRENNRVYYEKETRRKYYENQEIHQNFNRFRQIESGV